MDSLQGKTAVVTGAASGMGLAFSARFARAGMSVMMADIEVPALEAAAAELTASGATVATQVTDVSKGSDVEALLAATIERFGAAHVVCNNAGVSGAPGPIAVQTEADWQWTLGVNLWGVIHGCRVFLPHLLGHGDGHIVNTASVAGLTSMPGLGPYSVSKHGVVTLSEVMYGELAAAGGAVGVSVLCPGFVSTRILESERNRPESMMPPGGVAPRSEEDEAMFVMMREMIGASKPPAEVADLVHDAILERRFYIYTDDTFEAPIRARHRAIEERTPPPLPPDLP